VTCSTPTTIHTTCSSLRSGLKCRPAVSSSAMAMQWPSLSLLSSQTPWLSTRAHRSHPRLPSSLSTRRHPAEARRTREHSHAAADAVAPSIGRAIVASTRRFTSRSRPDRTHATPAASASGIRRISRGTQSSTSTRQACSTWLPVRLLHRQRRGCGAEKGGRYRRYRRMMM